jgi:hypothetical protein
MKKYITLALLLINLLLNAEVRYVSKTGSSIAPYTSWETACDSLQKCFDYCNNGDTVYVDRGIYRETIFLDNRVLTIIGIDTDECIIDGTGILGKVYNSVLFMQRSGNIVIKNITLKKKKKTTDNFCDDYYNVDGSLDINNCIFDTTLRALNPDGITRANNCIYRNVNCAVSVMRDYKITISNSLMSLKMWNDSSPAIINAVWSGSFEIYNNIIWGHEYNCFDGIYLCTGMGISIKNNLIYGFRSGIDASTFGDQPDTVEIVNNTIIDNKKVFAGITTGNMPAPIIIKNNLIVGFKTGIAFQHVNTNADYNLCYNVTRVTNMPPIGEHNIVADPMFNKDTTFSIDAIDNFKLQKFSPAIDAGDPSILDVDGTRSDIGMFGGPGGISYEYQDLAPKVVKKLTASYEPNTNNRVKLTWEPNTEADLKEYYVYKDIAPILTLDSTKRIAILTDTLLYDTIEQKAYYRVTAVDNTGNQGYPSGEVVVRVTDVNEVTITDNYEYALYQNYPNPFNPTTTISYSLKDDSEVRIKIYSISGELIKTIIEGNKSKGYNETQIDLSNMASGIYLYRLEVTGKGKIPVFNDLKKMVLVK